VSATRSDRIERAEHTILSERDTLLVLDLLENPPPASSKLIGAAKAWIDNQKKLEWEIEANRG
jgi:uncharacterized protein (DUF1778 family)